MKFVYKKARNRTRRAASFVSLDILGWGQTHMKAFNRCKKSLASLVTLAHGGETHHLFIYTDASDFCWLDMVTQILFEDLFFPHRNQIPKLRAFSSDSNAAHLF